MHSDWIDNYLNELTKIDVSDKTLSEGVKFSSLTKTSPLKLGELYFHQYVDIFPKYLELNKSDRAIWRQKIADSCALKVKTIVNRFGLLNSAYKEGVDLSNFHSFRQVEIILASKNKVESFDNNNEQFLETKKAELYGAENDEINSILESAIFKLILKEFYEKGWKLTNLIEALKTIEDKR